MMQVKMPDELFDVIKSIYLDDGKYSFEQVFPLFSKYSRDLDARWIDMFFGDCLYPLELHYDHWKAYFGKLSDLLEREKQLLESHSNGLIPDNLPALECGSYLSYQQRLIIFFATLCFYRNDIAGFKRYGTRMLLDSEENVKTYIDSLNGVNREKRSLSGMENPLIFFSSQRPFDSPCMKMIPVYLEEYVGFLHTLDLSTAYATEMGTRLLEEADMRLERAKEDCKEGITNGKT